MLLARTVRIYRLIFIRRGARGTAFMEMYIIASLMRGALRV